MSENADYKVDLSAFQKEPVEKDNSLDHKLDLTKTPETDESKEVSSQQEEQSSEVVNEQDEAHSSEETNQEDESQEVLETPAAQLPEGIDNLVSFMQETGGTVEDFVRLNANYDDVDNATLLREYYKHSKPHLDREDVNMLLEEFIPDEDMDEREAKMKKIAYKEEIAKAKDFLNNTKDQYYREIKGSAISPEQQKAIDFYNRYNDDKQKATVNFSNFQSKTQEFFSSNFEGFDFKLGDNTVKYKVENTDKVASGQDNIEKFVGKFLDENGAIKDLAGYHKAIYAAENADAIAKHFYEQGKADATKNVIKESKNISDKPRPTASPDVFVNGIKVRAVSGSDSSKLRIKKRN